MHKFMPGDQVSIKPYRYDGVIAPLERTKSGFITEVAFKDEKPFFHYYVRFSAENHQPYGGFFDEGSLRPAGVTATRMKRLERADGDIPVKVGSDVYFLHAVRSKACPQLWRVTNMSVPNWNHKLVSPTKIECVIVDSKGSIATCWDADLVVSISAEIANQASWSPMVIPK